MHVGLAAGASERGQLHVEDLQVVADPLRAPLGVDPFLQLGILRGYADRAPTRLHMVAETRLRVELLVVFDGADRGLPVFVPDAIVAAQGKQHRLADGDRVRPQCYGLRHVRAGAYAAGDDELDLLLHLQLLQGVVRLHHRGQRRDARVLDVYVLRRRRAALHPVHDDDIGPGLHRQLDVVLNPGRPDLHVHGDLPVGDLAQLLDLYGQVVGAGPVGVATRRTLIDTRGQGPHLRHALADLLPEQHAAAARLGALADDHLDGVGPPEVVRVEAVARGQA